MLPDRNARKVSIARLMTQLKATSASTLVEVSSMGGKVALEGDGTRSDAVDETEQLVIWKSRESMMCDRLCELETHTGERFLCVPNFQLPRIVNRLKPGLKAIYEPPLYFVRSESCSRLTDALRTGEFE